MKFGKQFDFYKIPEWSEFYFDYISIKKLLKYLDKRRHKNKTKKKLNQIHIEENDDNNDEESSIIENTDKNNIDSNANSNNITTYLIDENKEVKKAKKNQFIKIF